jgi:sugar phosphate isomerase/epimerase
MTSAQLDEFEASAIEFDIAVELGTRGLDAGNLLAYLELALRFRAPFVRLVIDSPGHPPTPEQTIDALRMPVAKYADSAVKLALENHDRFPTATLADIVEALGSDHVGICLDTVNSFGALEGPEVVIRTLAPYALNLHVKDFLIQRVGSQMGFTVAGCPAGQGRLNIPWLLEQLRGAGRDVNAILELWTPFEASLEETIRTEAAWAEASVKYLRQHIHE